MIKIILLISSIALVGAEPFNPALTDIEGTIDDLIGDWDMLTNKLKSQYNRSVMDVINDSDRVGGDQTRRILPPQLGKSQENGKKRLSIWDDLQKSMKRMKLKPSVPDTLNTLALDHSIINLNNHFSHD